MWSRAFSLGTLKCAVSSRLNRLNSFFLYLRPKLYALKYSDGFGEKIKFRGLKKCIVEQELNYDSFEKRLEGIILPHHQMHNIRAKLFQLYVEKSSKVSLCLNETKRKWVDVNTSFAYGNPQGRNL